MFATEKFDAVQIGNCLYNGKPMPVLPGEVLDFWKRLKILEASKAWAFPVLTILK